MRAIEYAKKQAKGGLTEKGTFIFCDKELNSNFLTVKVNRLEENNWTITLESRTSDEETLIFQYVPPELWPEEFQNHQDAHIWRTILNASKVLGEMRGSANHYSTPGSLAKRTGSNPRSNVYAMSNPL